YILSLEQHPKYKADAVTILKKIGNFLDNEVEHLYRKLKEDGVSKYKASDYIAEKVDLSKILNRSSKDWDGGYAIAGLLGHGDAFAMRDPSGIRPLYYYKDDEVVAVTSERPVLQTTFNIDFDQVEDVKPGHALITKRNGQTFVKKIIEPMAQKSCSFERIYFSRGNDAEIYRERKKLGEVLLPKVLEAIDYDTVNSVFSY